MEPRFLDRSTLFLNYTSICHDRAPANVRQAH